MELRDHPFSMYAKFCKKLTFLTPLFPPNKHTNMCVSGGKKC